jgi:hypothetical protein
MSESDRLRGPDITRRRVQGAKVVPDAVVRALDALTPDSEGGDRVALWRAACALDNPVAADAWAEQIASVELTAARLRARVEADVITAVEVREVPRLARAFRDLLALGGLDGQRRKPSKLEAFRGG